MKQKSEFLELAYAKNKIKNLKEAFDNYPVDEEEHKGKVENVYKLSEEDESYHKYEIGDIVFVKEYEYINETKGMNHLFVIVEENCIIPIEYFGMLISSKIEKIKFKENKLLQSDSLNHLNKDSIVKTDVLYKIAENNILFKIGKVENTRIEEYKKSFIELLNKENL